MITQPASPCQRTLSCDRKGSGRPHGATSGPGGRAGGRQQPLESRRAQGLAEWAVTSWRPVKRPDLVIVEGPSDSKVRVDFESPLRSPSTNEGGFERGSELS